MLLQSIKKCIIYLKPSCFHIGLPLHGTVMLCQVIPIDILDIGRTSIIPVLKKKKKKKAIQRQRKSVQFSPKFSELVASRERPEHRSCCSQFYILCLKLSSYLSHTGCNFIYYIFFQSNLKMFTRVKGTGSSIITQVETKTHNSMCSIQIFTWSFNPYFIYLGIQLIYKLQLKYKLQEILLCSIFFYQTYSTINQVKLVCECVCIYE